MVKILPGNFQIMTFDSVPEIVSGQVSKICWGTLKNIGDEDYVVFCLVDLSNNQVIGCAKSRETVPPFREMKWELNGKLTAKTGNYSIRCCAGHLISQDEMHVDSSRDFSIKIIGGNNGNGGNGGKKEEINWLMIGGIALGGLLLGYLLTR